MSVSTYIDPMGDTLPVGNVNPGGRDDGPFVILRLDGPGGHGHLSLGQLPLDKQAAYLTALRDLCGDLLTRVEAAQHSAALLAAVEATEHDPEAAAQIRASYPAGSPGPFVWRVVCDCGYAVEGLAREAAERFASQHGDEDHDPRVDLGDTSVVTS